MSAVGEYDEEDKIYIPFWLYSNTTKNVTDDNGIRFTFHSGYIPILINSSALLIFIKLYIPFWLYSNHSKTGVGNLGSYFTFHSGYIPIGAKPFFIYIEFTLHSILVIFQ